jgi:hypothetical protein
MIMLPSRPRDKLPLCWDGSPPLRPIDVFRLPSGFVFWHVFSQLKPRQPGTAQRPVLAVVFAPQRRSLWPRQKSWNMARLRQIRRTHI